MSHSTRTRKLIAIVMLTLVLTANAFAASSQISVLKRGHPVSDRLMEFVRSIVIPNLIKSPR